MEHSFKVRIGEERGRVGNQVILVSFSFLHGGKSSKDEESGTDKLEVSVNETINIFSIASGHLYERFLRCVCMFVR